MFIDHDEVFEDDISANTIVSSTNNKKIRSNRLRTAGKKYMRAKKNDEGKSYNIEMNSRMLVASNCSQRCEKQNKDRRCTETDESTRQAIFKSFWERMDWEQKRVYVLGLVERQRAKRKTVETDSRRNFTYQFYLRKGENRISVCKKYVFINPWYQ